MSRIILCSAIVVALTGISVCTAGADAVMDWNDLASVTSNADSAAHRESPDAWSPRDEAEEIVAVAIFQAVNAVNPRYTPFRAALAPLWSDATAAAAAVAAGHAALVHRDRRARRDASDCRAHGGQRRHADALSASRAAWRVGTHDTDHDPSVLLECQALAAVEHLAVPPQGAG
jgi:hypothetical protein